MAQQYVQLLGTDVPNSCGGCCFFGSLMHEALRVDVDTDTPHTTTTTPAHISPSSSSSSSSSLCWGGGGGSTGSDGYLLFNCPEGTQRFSSEANIKLTKIKGVFFTRWGAAATSLRVGAGASLPATRRTHGPQAPPNPVHGASAMMGLPGLLFTVNDAGVRHVNFFGPSSSVHARRALAQRAASMNTCTAEQLAARCYSASTTSVCATVCTTAHASLPGSADEGMRIATSSYVCQGKEDDTNNNNELLQLNQMCATQTESGLEKFLSVLRRHYFTHRCMTLRTLYSRHVWERCVDARSGTISSFHAPSREVGILCTSPVCDTSGHCTRPPRAAPFIVTSVQLNAQTALIVFRVSCDTSCHTMGSSMKYDAHINSRHTSRERQFDNKYEDEENKDDVHDEEGDTKVPKSSEGGVCGKAHRVTWQGGWEECAGCVFGYALVTSPPPKLDVQLARQCGVKPGPDLGVLKEGKAVYVHTEKHTGGLTRGGQAARRRPPPRTSHPTARSGVDAHTSGNTEENANHCINNTNDTKRYDANSDDSPSHTTTLHGETCADAASATAESAGRWVQPHEVMRETVASSCMYLSIILDGNTVADVQQAVSRLLGTAPQAAHPTIHTDDVFHCSGELFRVLQTDYPHLLYTCAGPAGSPTRRRQAILRHVVHVQPHSFFAAIPHDACSSVYATYVRTILAHVDDAILLSLEPSLSFAAADAIDDDVHFSHPPRSSHIPHESAGSSSESTCRASCKLKHDDGPKDVCEARNAQDERHTYPPPDSAPSWRRSYPPTRHLFTSFVSQHYTAFPSALVHRFHLHDTAPSLFPLPMNTSSQTLRLNETNAEVSAASAASSLTHQSTCRAHGNDTHARNVSASALVETDVTQKTSPARGAGAGADLTPKRMLNMDESSCATQAAYWPYSFKYRCIPEADAVEWQRSEGTASPVPPRGHTLAQTVNAVTAETMLTPLASSTPVNYHNTTDKDVNSEKNSNTRNRSSNNNNTNNNTNNNNITGTNNNNSKNNKTNGSSTRASCVSVGGLAGLIRYPTLSSARAMLSHTFRLPPTAVSATSTADTTRAQAQHRAISATSSATKMSATTTTTIATSAIAKDDTQSGAEADGGGALTFLGTGSAVPSKYRNVSGACLELQLPTHSGRLYRRGVIVLDFGEGSSGQLASLLCRPATNHPCSPSSSSYASSSLSSLPSALHSLSDEADAPLARWLQDVMLVFISHGHADHHLGLLSLLTLRHEYRANGAMRQPRDERRGSETNDEAEDPLWVVCPEEVYTFVMQSWGDTLPYAHWLQSECRFEVIPNSPPCSRSSSRQETAHPSHATGSWQPEKETCARDNNLSSPVSYLTAWCNARNASSSTCVAAAAASAAAAAAEHRDMRTCAVSSATAAAACATPCGPLSCANSSPAPRWEAAVVTVDHPANAHGLLLRFPHRRNAESLGSRTFFFSGDTRPSASLIDRVRDFCGAEEELFLCLHEATFGPGYEAEAREKRHSTVPEAMAVGEAMRARTTVLHHFSQRYPVLPGLTPQQLGGSRVDLHCRRHTSTAVTTGEEEVCDAGDDREVSVGEAGQSTCFAFDLMRLSFAALECGVVSALTPRFVRLLEEYESWGAGTTKRLRE